MYNSHSFFPNKWFNFVFYLVLFHKHSRFRTQYYNSIKISGSKEEYETLYYPYHRMTCFYP